MKSIILLLSATLFTGCFQIIEEINMKADGSGEMVLTLDMSQSMEKVRGYLDAGVVEGKEIPSQSQMESFLDDLEDDLAAMPGLSGVDIQRNWSSFIFKVRCRFSKVEDLDNAMYELAGKASSNSEKKWELKPNYRYQNGIFRRLFEYSPDPVDFQNLPTSRKVMLEQAKYMVIYRFEKAIDHYSNQAFQLSPSRKAVMLQTTPADIATGKVKPATEITFQ
ncbi:MAG: hypothetical protein D6816_12570 [Bacteroidetes bacterium]|nr:MAG: hypothetical protein D6816_12570 [Bacteroidota bacterium]